MRGTLVRFGRCAAGLGLGVLLLAAVATWVKHRSEIDPGSDERKLARSLEIIRTSTPTDRKVLKVLFYGQSITRTGWHNAVVAHWRERYPNTVFVVENRAIGGFASQYLERTTQQDIAAFYPDLIVFHVYGDHRSYERIVRMFRSQTAADVIVQTDHGEVLPDPPCAEGLQLTLHRQPGCAGLLWVHQRMWSDEMSYHKIPGFAKEYGLAMEPQRTWWRDYLLRTHIDPVSMTVDGLHPNEQGKALIAGFFNRYFDDLVDHWQGETESDVVSIPIGEDARATGQLVAGFAGSRIELLSSKPLAHWPGVTVDGADPKQLDGCYQVSRASSLDNVPDWPALRKVTLVHDRTAEEWTAAIHSISPDQRSFDYSVQSSVNGDQGAGNSAQDFVAASGNLRIEAQDWMFRHAFESGYAPLKPPIVVRWSVNYVCGGSPEVIDLGGGAAQYRYILAAGLANGPHSLTVSAPPGALASVTELRAYAPPLHSE